jgi:hypothetical protein
VFKLAIGQLALKFEGVANKGIGTLLGLSTARIFKEVSEAVMHIDRAVEQVDIQKNLLIFLDKNPPQ